MDPVDATEVTLRIGMTLSKDIKESDLNRLVNAKIWSYRMDRITGGSGRGCNVDGSDCGAHANRGR